MYEPMRGALVLGGQVVARAGFVNTGFNPSAGAQSLVVGPSIPIYARGSTLSARANDFLERGRTASEIERGALMGDGAWVGELLQTVNELQRAITTTTTAFPVRENLEAPAKVLVPLDTPVRNMLPRTVGAGLASAWRQVTSLGGGYGFLSTVTSGATSATQTVGSTAGMQVGDVLQFTQADGTSIGTKIVSSITSSTVVVLTTSVATTTGDIVVNTSRPAGAGAGALSHTRAFYAEGGCPADHATVYASKSVSYKQIGTFGSVTGLAMAAGRNWGPQLETEKRNALLNLFLLEENALINGSSTATYPPWGNGTTAYGFDGLLNLITTANGVPTDQVQTSVGSLTLSHIDNQLGRIYDQGGQGQWILASRQEILSLTHLAEAAGSIIRVPGNANGDVTLGVTVTSYKHPVTGENVPVFASRFLAPGTMIFGSKFLPDGQAAADVSVLPQVELPESAFAEGIMGYTARELAPNSSTGCDTFPFMISSYEALRLLGSTVFAKSVGLTAV